MHKYALLIVAIALLPATAVSQDKKTIKDYLEVGGYVRHMNTLSFLELDEMLTDNLVHNRINLKAQAAYLSALIDAMDVLRGLVKEGVGLLDGNDSQVFEASTRRDCLTRTPALICINRDIDLWAKDLPHRAHSGDIGFDIEANLDLDR